MILNQLLSLSILYSVKYFQAYDLKEDIIMKITLRQQCNVRRAIHAVLLAEIKEENRDTLTQNLFADTFMIQPNFSSILRKKNESVFSSIAKASWDPWVYPIPYQPNFHAYRPKNH